MDTPAALDMMERSLTVAADSAAYYDRSLDETTESLQSFLKGNFENDAALGLSCTETTRNAAANELSGKSFMELSEAQKQLTLLQMVEDANELSGAMGQAARESDGWENVIGNLKESIKQLSASIGEVILPTVVSITQKITESIEAFSRMGEGTKKLIVALLAITAAAAPALTVFGKIMTVSGKFVSAVSRLNTAFLGCMAAVRNYTAATDGASFAAGVANGNLTKQQAIVGGLASKINTLTTTTLKSTAATVKDTAANAVATSKVGTAASGAAKKVLAFAAANKVAIIAALGLAAPIIALVAYMAKTGASADEVAAKITGFADKLASMITTFANAFPSMVDGLVSAFISVIDSVVAVLPTLIPALLGAAVQLFMALVEALPTVINALTAALPTIITAVVGALVAALPTLLQAAVQLFMALVEAIPTVVDALVAAIPTIIQSIVGVLPTLIPALLQGAITLFMALVQALPTVISALVEAIPQIIDAVVGMLPTLIPALIDGAVQLFMAFVYAIPQIAVAVVQALPQIIQALWNGLVLALETIWSAIKSSASAAWEAIKSAAVEKWNNIKEQITQPIENAKQNIKSKIEAIKSFFSFDALISKVKAKWDSIKSKIVNPIDTAKQKVQSALNKIKGMFPLSIGKIFSNLKLPHISVDGGKAPFGIAGKGKLPSFHVNWNAKGAIFDEPTIFATAKGLQGVGEAGAEAVTPIDTLKTYVREAVASENVMQEDLMQQMIDSNNRTNQLLNAILQMLSNQKIEWNDRELGRFVRNYA